MKIITPKPPKALDYDEIPDGSVFMFSQTYPTYFLKLRNSDGAVNLQNSTFCFGSSFTHEGEKFYLVDAELVIK